MLVKEETLSLSDKPMWTNNSDAKYGKEMWCFSENTFFCSQLSWVWNYYLLFQGINDRHLSDWTVQKEIPCEGQPSTFSELLSGSSLIDTASCAIF